MLEVRTLRPLPSEGRVSQFALGDLTAPGLHLVHAPPGCVVSEDAAAVLDAINGRPAWVRLSRLDAHPGYLAETLATTVPEARGRMLRCTTLEEVGRALAGNPTHSPPFVIESTTDRSGAVAALRLAHGAVSAPGKRCVVVIAHRRLPRRMVPRDADVIGEKQLALGSDPKSRRIALAVADLGVLVIAQLLRLAAGQRAVVLDLLDAALTRDAELVAIAVSRCRRKSMLLDTATECVLRTCSALEIEALSVAATLGYWHPSLGPGVDGSLLRPWLIPLEDGWFWLRPVWRPSLSRRLRGLPMALPHAAITRRARAAHVAMAPPPGTPAIPPIIPTPPDTIDGGGRGQPSDHGSKEKPAASLRMDVHLLGHFEVRIDGVTVESWEGRLGPMILKYLLVQPRRSSPRDVLMETFWPETDPERARNRLHVALCGLRRSLRSVTELDVLEYSNGSYRLSDQFELHVDVDDFTRALAEGRRLEAAGQMPLALDCYRRAIECYGGDLFAETPFEDWSLVAREALRMDYLDALNRTACLLEAHGGTDECIRIATKVLAEDPCSEEAHRLLMRSHAAQGNHRQAIRQFELCKRVLKRELGAGPAPETMRTYEAVRRDAATPG